MSKKRTLQQEILSYKEHISPQKIKKVGQILFQLSPDQVIIETSEEEYKIPVNLTKVLVDLIDKLNYLVQNDKDDEVLNLLRSSFTDLAQQALSFDDSRLLNFLLERAMWKGKLDLFNLLVDLTPDPIERDNMLHFNNDCAFHGAAVKNHTEIIKRLIELTKDDNALKAMLYQHNNFAINRAAEHGNAELLEIYFQLAEERGHEELSLKTSKNDMLYLYTITNCNIEAVKLVERYKLAASSQKDLDAMIHMKYDSMFLNASSKGSVQIMQHLLDSTANPDLRNKMIHTLSDEPFIQAAKYGRFEAMELLLKLTPDPAQKYAMIHAQADSPIAAALSHQEPEVVRFLIKEAKLAASALGKDEKTIGNEEKAMFHEMEDGAFKMAIARDAADFYKKYSKYGKTNVGGYGGTEKKNSSDIKVSPEIIDIFFDYDFLYFKDLYHKLAATLFLTKKAKACIEEEIAKYDAMLEADGGYSEEKMVELSGDIVSKFIVE